MSQRDQSQQFPDIYSAPISASLLHVSTPDFSSPPLLCPQLPSPSPHHPSFRFPPFQPPHPQAAASPRRSRRSCSASPSFTPSSRSAASLGPSVGIFPTVSGGLGAMGTWLLPGAQPLLAAWCWEPKIAGWHAMVAMDNSPCSPPPHHSHGQLIHLISYDLFRNVLNRLVLCIPGHVRVQALTTVTCASACASCACTSTKTRRCRTMRSSTPSESATTAGGEARRWPGHVPLLLVNVLHLPIGHLGHNHGLAGALNRVKLSYHILKGGG